MPILVEPDTTTAGVLTSALPAGSQVVARPDDVDALAQRARRVRTSCSAPPSTCAAATALAERVRGGAPRPRPWC